MFGEAALVRNFDPVIYTNAQAQLQIWKCATLQVQLLLQSVIVDEQE